jgi:2-methylisocitrate lyase-like PEP mutase family enzyme
MEIHIVQLVTGSSLAGTEAAHDPATPQPRVFRERHPMQCDTPSQRRRRFRDLIEAGMVACPGAYDALSARALERAGAKAVYVSGFAAAASAFALPDLGIVSQSDMAEHVRRICAATSLPVFADADTGYGGTLNVAATVSLWEAAGAAALHLEDQTFPKRCGHLAGKSVVSTSEMVERIGAALDARRDPDLLIVARTDAIAVNGLDDALERCRAYARAGADALFVDAPADAEQVARIGRLSAELGKPLVFNSARTGKSPCMDERSLADAGYRIVIYPIELLCAAQLVVAEVAAILLTAGDTSAIADRLATFARINDLVELEHYLRRDVRSPTGVAVVDRPAN